MPDSIKKIMPLFLLMILIALSGCGSDRQEVNRQQINIAVQSLPNDESIARSWYDEELSKALGVKVIVINYDSSLLANNAMATDNIDIAIFGSATAAIGISNGLPYEVFWIHNIEGDNEALVVKHDSDINSIADLKGKRVAVTFGATTHYSLLLAMQRAGVSVDDVTLFDLQPNEIVDNWLQGNIDAAYIWQPTLGELANDGRILISSRQLDEQGITTADVGVVNKRFARQHPDIVRKYVEMQVRAHELFKDEPHHASELTADTLDISSNAALKQMRELVWIDAEDQISGRYLGTSEHKGKFAETLSETAKFLESCNLVKRAATLDNFQKAINPSFIEAVVK